MICYADLFTVCRSQFLTNYPEMNMLAEGNQRRLKYTIYKHSCLFLKVPHNFPLIFGQFATPRYLTWLSWGTNLSGKTFTIWGCSQLGYHPFTGGLTWLGVTCEEPCRSCGKLPVLPVLLVHWGRGVINLATPLSPPQLRSTSISYSQSQLLFMLHVQFSNIAIQKDCSQANHIQYHTTQPNHISY